MGDEAAESEFMVVLLIQVTHEEKVCAIRTGRRRLCNQVPFIGSIWLLPSRSFFHYNGVATTGSFGLGLSNVFSCFQVAEKPCRQGDLNRA
jgi:hypothetical protein